MKKYLLFSLVLIGIFVSTGVIVANGYSTNTDTAAKISEGKLITDFYKQKCSGKPFCTKCYTDCFRPYYYCLTYNGNKQLTGKIYCDKNGLSCASPTEVYKFNDNDQLISYKGIYSYNISNGKILSNVKWKESTYKYDNMGRVSKASSKFGDMAYGFMEETSYSYNGNNQIASYYRNETKVPFLDTSKISKQHISSCDNDKCKYPSLPISINCASAGENMPEMNNKTVSKDDFVNGNKIHFNKTGCNQNGEDCKYVETTEYNFLNQKILYKAKCDQNGNNCSKYQKFQYYPNGKLKTEIKGNSCVNSQNCKDNQITEYNDKEKVTYKKHNCDSNFENCKYEAYEYDTKDQLTSVRLFCNANFQNCGCISRYEYNAEGRVISRKECNNQYLPITKVEIYDSKGHSVLQRKNECNSNYTECKSCWSKGLSQYKCEQINVNGQRLYK